MLVFVHGWGLDSALWNPLLTQLDLPATTLDLGHLAPAQTPALPPTFIGIGHSFGALWLLHTMPHRLAGFIAIAGFARFPEAPGWPGVPARPLHRMRAAFPQRPAEILNEFRARCALPAIAAPADPAPLADGLTALATWDARATLSTLQAPTLVLAASDDPIVPPALAAATAALAAAPLHVTETGGHILPLTQPAWCARHIRAFAA